MELTKEEQIQAIYDLKVGYTLGHADIAILKSMARQLLTGMEQEPVAYMYKDRLHTDARFSLHTRFGNWSQEDINEYKITEIPLYAAPQLPKPAMEALKRLRSIVADPKTLPRRKEWISGQQYSYVLLESVEAMVDDACRAAMLQDAEPVSQPYTLRDGWVAVPVDMTPEQMRAVQLNSELCSYASANMSGAYSLFREFWDVAIAAAPQQETN